MPQSSTSVLDRADVPPRDPARATARVCGVVDALREESFERLTRLAAVALDAPATAVTILDAEGQFYIRSAGLARDEPRGRRLVQAFCRFVVATREAVMIDDIATHPWLAADPALRELGAGAFLGVPLLTREGQLIGALCAIDGVPRQWTEQQVKALTDLATLAMTEVELRRDLAERSNLAGPCSGRRRRS